MGSREHPPQDEPTARLHVPVLLDTCIQVMQPSSGESYLDLTAGYGGHAATFLAKTNAYSKATLVDRDQMAIDQLADFERKGATLLHTDFVSAAKALHEQGKQFDLIFVDLGVSSPQLDRAERGFSFSMDGPLDMRMDQRIEKNAATLINTIREPELVRILTEYGEERLGPAKRIAKAIIAGRPFSGTKELSDCILSTHRGSWQRTHPATRTFQALRIAVNDELGQIAALLPLVPDLLASGGRVGILSFHSLEDRPVKQFFKEHAEAGYEADLDVLTKKPLDGATYDVHNPRSRSAKLRVAVKK